MRCTDPRPVGFLADGKTICWSSKKSSKEYASFQLPCGQCLECRLEYARQWAIRCVHEAKMYEKNCFITLTYSDENLKSPKLQYIDFQLFAKRLRDHIFQDFLKKFGKLNWSILSKQQKKEHYEKIQIGIFVTGEYGEKTKRPHWHAIVFNWSPADLRSRRTTDLGDEVFSSRTLDSLWGKNNSETRPCEIGDVTFRSAGYVARYAAKKLVHGVDAEHDFVPISKKSSHQAIGKKYLEKNWQDVFSTGKVILIDGTTCSIPRYYEKWLKKNQPQAWERYVTQRKADIIAKASEKSELESQASRERNFARGLKGHETSKRQAARKIMRQKFKLLQDYLKL